MTPPARPDPVAALLNERGYINMSGDRFREHLAEQGYVLVNADMLAEARQQMKAETRDQIFRDNGLIADPLHWTDPGIKSSNPDGTVSVRPSEARQPDSEALRLRLALEELIEDSCVEGPDCGTYESHKRAYAALAVQASPSTAEREGAE